MRVIRKATGFTLIEVLVAMVILAVGLLGLAGLQMLGLKNVQNSFSRNQASLLSYDMADRMRANTLESQKYAASAYVTTTNLSSQSDCNAVSTTCTPTKLAINDLSNWREQLKASLPEGSGTITQANSIYTITISWNENTYTGGSAQQFILRFQL